MRIRLSNAYGSEPLRLDAVSIAQCTKGSGIDPASATAIRFNGQPGVTIAPGA